MKLDVTKLRSLDVFFTSDISFFAFLEKSTINGLWSAMTDSGCKLPSHVGWFVEIEGFLKIFEMSVDKNDHGIMKLTEGDIHKYENNGWFGDRIIAIKRLSIFDNIDLRKQVEEKIIKDEASGFIRYDIKELFGFWGLKKLFGNPPNKFICSSYVEKVIEDIGYSFTNFPLQRNDILSPYNIYSAKNIVSSKSEKSEFDFII
jgi:hypothetical protein